MVAIFLLSGQSDLPGSEYLWDKGAHLLAYGLFGVLCLRAFHGGIRPLRPIPTILAMGLTLAYAVIDEWHQAHVPGRDPSLLDWIADALGAGLAIPLVWLLARLRPQEEHLVPAPVSSSRDSERP